MIQEIQVANLGAVVIKEVLEHSKPRPVIGNAQTDKNKYAVRFADKMAILIARDLSPKLKGVAATTKRSASSVQKKKQLDVNFSTPSLGLALGISLKSVHLGDPKNGRYTHNMKRNEEELRVEATGYHKRQPYAVMVGVIFLPFDSCEDGRRDNSSSFGSWVRHLRPYAGRMATSDDADKFEKIYLGLYEVDGSDLRFFDIETAPPKNKRPPLGGVLHGADAKPRRLLSYEEFLAEAYHAYLRRNSAEFQWAGGEEDPLEIEDLEPDGPAPES